MWTVFVISQILTKVVMILAIVIYLLEGCLSLNSYDIQGPVFHIEPQSQLEFVNVNGGVLHCMASGNPMPNVQWADQENNIVSSISKLRHILPNGTLYFLQFDAELFRQDIHWTIYRCIASNSMGTIISRDVSVKAVVNQRYDPEVQNPGGIIGSNVLLRCNIPSFVKKYVTITSWLQEPSYNIYPTIESDGKYHMLPTGELLILNLTRADAKRTYRCRTHHQLTQESVVSSTAGCIQLSEIHESMPPFFNDKQMISSVKKDEFIVIPCVSYASPRPRYRAISGVQMSKAQNSMKHRRASWHWHRKFNQKRARK